jgi:hypothetical protein
LVAANVFVERFDLALDAECRKHAHDHEDPRKQGDG